MGYNHAAEKRKFDREWAKKKARYIELGMTEEQINEIYMLDVKQFNGDRAYYEKKIDTDSPESYTEPKADDPSDEYLLENWIELIDDPNKYNMLKKMPSDMRKAFYLYRVLNYSQIEISSLLMTPRRTITWWISKITEILK